MSKDCSKRGFGRELAVLLAGAVIGAASTAGGTLWLRNIEQGAERKQVAALICADLPRLTVIEAQRQSRFEIAFAALRQGAGMDASSPNRNLIHHYFYPAPQADVEALLGDVLSSRVAILTPDQVRAVYDAYAAAHEARRRFDFLSASVVAQAVNSRVREDMESYKAATLDMTDKGRRAAETLNCRSASTT